MTNENLNALENACTDMRYLNKDNLEQQKKTSLEIVYYSFSLAQALSDIIAWEDMMSLTAVEHQEEILVFWFHF